MESQLNDPPPPNYNDVLKKAIECGAVLPIQATQNTTTVIEQQQVPSMERPHSSTVSNTMDVSMVSVSSDDESLPSSSRNSQGSVDADNNSCPATPRCTASLPRGMILDEHSVANTSQDDLIVPSDDDDDGDEEEYVSTSQDNAEIHGLPQGSCADESPSRISLASVIIMSGCSGTPHSSSQQDLIVYENDIEIEEQCEITMPSDHPQQDRNRATNPPPSSRSSSVVIIMDEHSLANISTEDLIGAQLDEEDQGFEPASTNSSSRVPETLLSLAQKFKAKTAGFMMET